jgi:SAM-dependent methyltransferase
MSEHWPAGAAAREAYDALAPAYDEFVGNYEYERWTTTLLGKAVEYGAGGNRLLDVGCGTGLSLVTMVDRGWEVTGCDISPPMLEVARAKVGDRANLLVADMRDLPDLGEFDLVWAINDPFNYLLSREELVAALDGMRRNLMPDGVALFDLATLVNCRSLFSDAHVVETGGGSMRWQGQMAPEKVLPGAIAEATVEASGTPESAHVHRLRHFSEAEALESLEAAGLRCVASYGELDGKLDHDLDEELHKMAVYVCKLR